MMQLPLHGMLLWAGCLSEYGLGLRTVTCGGLVDFEGGGETGVRRVMPMLCKMPVFAAALQQPVLAVAAKPCSAHDLRVLILGCGCLP